MNGPDSALLGEPRPSVVHALAWYAPESWGGTEQYVAGLVRSLALKGTVSAVLAPSVDGHWAVYQHSGAAVVRYIDTSTVDGARRLRAWLVESAASIFHLHSWTPLCGERELGIARSAGMRTVVTVHIPAPVCARGTMLRDGAIPCDGQILVGRCAACWMHSRGLSLAGARAMAAIPAKVANLLSPIFGSGRMRHLLHARAEMDSRLAGLQRVGRDADRVVAVCDWLRAALLGNGIAERKVVTSRQAVEPTWIESLRAIQRAPRGRELRVSCVGRWDELKGQALLVEAVKAMPIEFGIRIRFIAPHAADESARKYEALVRSMAGSETRFQFAVAGDRAELAAFFADTDILAVPSQWFETGPLVVMEAQAAGVPVLGSDIGGIAELVKSGVDGWLVPYSDVNAWSSALTALASGTWALPDVRLAHRWPRTTDDIAAEMLQVYEAILGYAVRGSTGALE